MSESRPTWLSRPLHDFHFPQGLIDRLTHSREAAEQQLQQEGFANL